MIVPDFFIESVSNFGEVLCFDWYFALIVDAKAANFQIIPLKFVFPAERLGKTEKQIMTSLTKSCSSEASRKSTDYNRRAYSPDFWTQFGVFNSDLGLLGVAIQAENNVIVSPKLWLSPRKNHLRAFMLGNPNIISNAKGRMQMLLISVLPICW